MPQAFPKIPLTFQVVYLSFYFTKTVELKDRFLWEKISNGFYIDIAYGTSSCFVYSTL